MKGLVALFLAAVVVSGCSASASPNSPASDSGFVGGDGSIVIVEEGKRKSAPALVGSTLTGGAFDLSDQVGQIVVMNVWASWCAPCRAEAPELEDVWQDVQDEGVVMVGLNTRDSAVAARGFIQTMGLTFPSIEDSDGRLQLQFSDSLPPQAIPSTVVIDRQGRVAARILGKVSASTLRGVINEVDARE